MKEKIDLKDKFMSNAKFSKEFISEGDYCLYISYIEELFDYLFERIYSKYMIYNDIGMFNEDELETKIKDMFWTIYSENERFYNEDSEKPIDLGPGYLYIYIGVTPDFGKVYPVEVISKICAKILLKIKKKLDKKEGD